MARKEQDGRQDASVAKWVKPSIVLCFCLHLHASTSRGVEMVQNVKKRA